MKRAPRPTSIPQILAGHRIGANRMSGSTGGITISVRSRRRGVAETTNQLEYDDEVAFFARQRLHQLARREEDRPFCLTVSFTHPHDPFVTRQKYWDLYPEDKNAVLAAGNDRL